MKRLLLGIAIASLVGSIAQAFPVEAVEAQDIEVYTDTNKAEGDLAPLIEGGERPYIFKHAGIAVVPVNGSVQLNPNGTFLFVLNYGETNGSFRYHVLDANQVESNDATVTIQKKEKLD